MCGVLGVTIKNFNNEDGDLVRRLFQQSMIRGKHATGVSYVKDNKVHTVKDSIPADEWIAKQNLQEWINEDGNLYCIGHIRYSTSDLRYNQPMASDKIAIVHNGVITQEPKSTWEERYELRTETSNDSELVLRAVEKDENPLIFFYPASMAVCMLFKNKRLSAFRNHERPLYYYSDERMTIFASTKDILNRSGISRSEKTRMFEIYNVNNFELSHFEVADDQWLENKFSIKDLQ
jgi:glutamine phosphoribosylpyrophosphate amidotransferase